MMRFRWWRLAAAGALVVVVGFPLACVGVVVLLLLPEWMRWLNLGLFAVVAVWALVKFGRRGAPSTEIDLMGRSAGSEGLL